MTQLLRDLLAEEAGRIEVPEPRPALIVRRSRRARLRRRATRGAAVLTAAAVAATIAVVVHLSGADDASGPLTAQQRFERAAAGPAYATYGAFTVGSVVHIGNHQVDLEEPVKAVYYTSEGALVRSGDSAATEAAGPSRYTLVSPDGSTRAVDLRMGDRVPGTDPHSPYVTYLDPGAGPRQWFFVVVDLRTGEEVARQAETGRFTWGGWEAPPATTLGTSVWGLFDDGWHQYDWETGTVRVVPGTRGGDLAAMHGLTAEARGRDGAVTDVVDLATGDRVATVRIDPMGETLTLSTDGRHARVSGYVTYDADGNLLEVEPSRFVSLDTGRSVEVPLGAELGWTPDGDALAVDQEAGEVTVCDPGDGSCETVAVDVGEGTVKLGGRTYES